MKLFHSPNSPFVRKVMVAALELGLDDRIQLIPCAPHPTRPNQELAEQNPLLKIPTLITDDGEALYPSGLICEYLDELDGRHRLFPAQARDRRTALLEHALGDGILDAALLGRYETTRPAELQWPDWLQGQLRKVEAGLNELERRVQNFGERMDIGTITLACALGYLDFRYADLDWRQRYPLTAQWYQHFSQRPSLARTQPQS